jgi:multidrug efflux pump subunit AcrA (membrane-fusion protein)
MKKNIKTVLLAVLIIALGFVLFKMFSGMKKKPEPTQTFKSIKYVRVDEVNYQDHIAEIVAFGKVKSFNRIEVYSEVAGIVLDNGQRFKVGNSFSSGQVMINVDDEEARLNLYSQKSDFLNVLTRMLPDIKADFPDAFQTWNKYLEDFNIEGAIKELPATRSSKEKYFLAARNIYKLYYAIKNIEVRLSKYKIKAPFAGVVTQSLIENGTSIRVGQKLGDFAGTNSFELELPISENEINYLSIGNSVEVINENNNKTWTGRIARVSEHIDASSQTINVYVSISGKDLYDGMYLKGVIKGRKIENAFKIPRKAIVNNEFIHTVKDSLLGRKQINILLQGETDAYINGINEGETVVVETLVNTALGTKIITIKNNENK